MEKVWSPLCTDYGTYDPLQSGSIDGTDTLPHDHAIIRAATARCELILLLLLLVSKNLSSCYNFSAFQTNPTSR